MGVNRIPYIVTNDGRTIRYPNPNLAINDTIKLNLVDNKVTDIAKFEIGNVAFIISGNNIGRVGVITTIDRHNGGFDIVNLKDANGK